MRTRVRAEEAVCHRHAPDFDGAVALIRAPRLASRRLLTPTTPTNHRHNDEHAKVGGGYLRASASSKYADVGGVGRTDGLMVVSARSYKFNEAKRAVSPRLISAWHLSA